MFIETNTKYHSGFEIQEYEGKFSLVSARKPDNKVYIVWGEIEIGKDKTKKMPVRVDLGSKEQAISALKQAIAFLSSDEVPF